MKTKRSEMSDLADVVVHDLKNPLAIILTSAEILSSGALDNDIVKRKSFLDRVYESARILSSRATNIVDIERIESGTLSLRPEDMTVGRLLSSLEWIKASAARQSKTLTLDGDANIEFTLDPNLTLRICENLLLNAMKNTTTGGKISMAIRKAGDHISFTVNDNGPLITKEEIKQAWFQGEDVNS